MRSSKEFGNALRFATRLHARQTRKGSATPYISHLLAVTAIALEHGATENEAIAALFHDAVEDQGGRKTLRRIRRRFGKRVARIVAACSDTDQEPKPPWRERKEAYVARLLSEPYSVRLVVAADKLHNARHLLGSYRIHGDELWSHFKGGRDGTLWYYDAVLDSLETARQPDEVQLKAINDEIARTLIDLKQEVAGQAETGQPGKLP